MHRQTLFLIRMKTNAYVIKTFSYFFLTIFTLTFLPYFFFYLIINNEYESMVFKTFLNANARMIRRLRTMVGTFEGWSQTPWFPKGHPWNVMKS